MAALGVFKMQCLKRNNIIYLKNDIGREDTIQRDREYLLAELNNYIISNEKEDIKELLLKGYTFSYSSSTITYIPVKDSFYLLFYKDGRFIKEELYKYSIINGSIYYGKMESSFKQGVVNR